MASFQAVNAYIELFCKYLYLKEKSSIVTYREERLRKVNYLLSYFAQKLEEKSVFSSRYSLKSTGCILVMISEHTLSKVQLSLALKGEAEAQRMGIIF